MTTEPIVAEIVKTIDGLVTCGKLWAYLFGSALRPDSMWSDVDILIVCEVEKDGQLARDTLSELCALYPIDLEIMTSQEEVEFDFIRSENCHGSPPRFVTRAETSRSAKIRGNREQIEL
ncbi:MAG: nucleotidyltransferase domain-containing protein [Alphaproteobacteria bacterium]|nr:MAG: nucleotidyltransferase domain-containing protein [Alphaproteobacteria bacterium]